MADVHFIQEHGKPVLLVDLTGIRDYEHLPALTGKAIDLAHASDGPHSVRTLIDLKGTRINGRIISSLKNLSRNKGQYALATAFVGLPAVRSVLLSRFFRVTGKKNHRVFLTRAEALPWLAQW